MHNIRNINTTELKKFLQKNNEKAFRANQIEEWLWKNWAGSFEEMTNLSKSVRDLLAKNFTFENLEVITEQKSVDGTVKFGFKLYDGNIVEGVLIPTNGRSTACISSQVGCQLACLFCATAKIKFKRNLEPWEIVGQVMIINKLNESIYGKKLSNIVYMGMGEPLLNYDNVLKSVALLTNEKYMGFSPQRITISTAGLAKEIIRLGNDHIKFNLAISLHTANSIKRDNLMPINKSNSLPELTEAIKYFHTQTGLRVTFEYLMLNDYNDSLVDVKELALFCKSFPCKINIIEYNEVSESDFKKTTLDKLTAFIAYLESKNMVVNLRKSRGTDIDAACGQLANKK